MSLGPGCFASEGVVSRTLADQLHFRGSATQLYALWYVLRHLDVWQRAILPRPTRSHAPQYILNGVNVWHLCGTHTFGRDPVESISLSNQKPGAIASGSCGEISSGWRPRSSRVSASNALTCGAETAPICCSVSQNES